MPFPLHSEPNEKTKESLEKNKISPLLLVKAGLEIGACFVNSLPVQFSPTLEEASKGKTESAERHI